MRMCAALRLSSRGVSPVSTGARAKSSESKPMPFSFWATVRTGYRQGRQSGSGGPVRLVPGLILHCVSQAPPEDAESSDCSTSCTDGLLLPAAPQNASSSTCCSEAMPEAT